MNRHKFLSGLAAAPAVGIGAVGTAIKLVESWQPYWVDVGPSAQLAKFSKEINREYIRSEMFSPYAGSDD